MSGLSALRCIIPVGGLSALRGTIPGGSGFCCTIPDDGGFSALRCTIPDFGGLSALRCTTPGGGVVPHLVGAAVAVSTSSDTTTAIIVYFISCRSVYCGDYCEEAHDDVFIHVSTPEWSGHVPGRGGLGTRLELQV